MKFMKRFLTFIFILLLVTVVALWWLPAPLIKWAIENPGSQAAGAQIDVGGVDFSWFPTAITITDLAVTNPRQPMTNAVEITHLSTEVDAMELLGGKVYLEQVLVEGIALDQPRAVSGALPGRPAAPDDEAQFALPDLGLPDTSALVEKEKAIYQQRIDAFNEELKQREQRWQQSLNDLPDDEALKAYKARWDKAQAGSVLDKLSAAKSISKDLKQDIKELKSGEQQLQAEYRQLQEDYRQLASLSDKSVDQIIRELGLSDSMIANLGDKIISGKVQQWLRMGEGYYQLLTGGDTGEGAADDEAAGAESDAIKTAPDFLVKLMRLSGPFVQGGREGTIDGEIRNLSDAPGLWPEPVTIKIQALGDTLGKINIDGLLAHQRAGAEQDTLTLSVADSQLQNLALSQSENLGLLVNKALLNLNVAASIEALSTLDLDLQGVFSNLDLMLAGDNNADWQQTLAKSVSSLNKLTLEGAAQGPLHDPSLSLSTNLNGIMKQALSAEIRQRSQALRKKLQTQLGQTLESQLQPLQSKVAGLGSVPGQAGSRVKEFESMLKDIR